MRVNRRKRRSLLVKASLHPRRVELRVLPGRLRRVRVLECRCVRKVRARQARRVLWALRRERHVRAEVRRRVAKDFRSVRVVLHSRDNSVRERRKVRAPVVRNNFVRAPARKAAQWVRRVKVVLVRHRRDFRRVQAVVVAVRVGATTKLL
jgi:hypothetical protein